MKEYLVIGIYEDDFARFATTVLAKDPKEAESNAQAEATSALIVAAVIDKATFEIVA